MGGAQKAGGARFAQCLRKLRRKLIKGLAGNVSAQGWRKVRASSRSSENRPSNTNAKSQPSGVDFCARCLARCLAPCWRKLRASSAQAWVANVGAQCDAGLNTQPPGERPCQSEAFGGSDARSCVEIRVSASRRPCHQWPLGGSCGRTHHNSPKHTP